MEDLRATFSPNGGHVQWCSQDMVSRYADPLNGSEG